MRCFYCMEEYDEDLDVICPFCGNDVVGPTNDNTCLPAGSVLKQRYVLGRVLGDGGFGITYIGYDKALKRKVAVKEFFPNECVTRQKGEATVSPLNGERGERYRSGLKSFQEEAQRLANLGSVEGVVNVYDVFADNGTAYIVMEYLSGDTVAQMVEKNKVLGFGRTMNIIVPVLRSLIKVHQAGIIHRDISPQNIIKTKEGKIVLIDFGAARQNTFSMSKSVSIILKQGYAPIEQYDNKMEQNSWTDVYAVAATMYYMLTGVTPEFANSRALEDKLVPVSQLRTGLPPQLDDILAKALAVRPEERTQTAQELLDQIMTLKNFKPPVRKKPKNPDKVATERISAKSQWKSYTSTKPITIEDPAEKEYRPQVITIDRKNKAEDPLEKEPLVPEKQKTKVSIPLVVGIFVSLAVLAVLAVVGYNRNNTVLIPDFIGQNIDQVQSANEEGFVFEIVNAYDPDTDLDIVVNQSPIASSYRVKKGSTVRLTVNTTDYEVTVPVLTKMSRSVAENTLKSLYLQSEVEVVSNDDYADGMVISTEPSNGSKVKVNSTVKLYVAENSVSVPDLKGKTLQEATDELVGLGLKVGEISYDYSSEYATGSVSDQSTVMGTKVLKGTEIPITISRGEPIPVQLDTSVDLSALSTPFTVKVTCDGIVESEKKRYSLIFDSNYDISITRNINEGAKTVEVYIDDELYQSYTFDFENNSVSLDYQNDDISAAKKNSREESASSKTESRSAAESEITSSAASETFPSAASQDESSAYSSQTSSYSVSSQTSAAVFPQLSSDIVTSER